MHVYNNAKYYYNLFFLLINFLLRTLFKFKAYTEFPFHRQVRKQTNNIIPLFLKQTLKWAQIGEVNVIVLAEN